MGLAARLLTFTVPVLCAPPMLIAQRPAARPDSARVEVLREGPYRSSATDSSQRVVLWQTHQALATVVFVHGGSLTSGDRYDAPAREMCLNFVRARIECASINYRLVGQAKWPAQPEDVAAAVAWVAKHVAAFGRDPKGIYLFGHSSGCHLAALVATDTTYLTAVGLSPRDLGGVIAMGCLLRQIPPAISDSTELRRFFTSGRWIYPSLETFRDADPTLHVGPHVPPTLVLIAETEQQQPPILESAQRFADRMRAAGRTTDLSVLPNRNHLSALTMMQDPLDPTFMQIVAFISKTHR